MHSGRVRLADWGHATNNANSTSRAGTRRYSAPEALDPRRPIDLAAADVWSRGATLLAFIGRHNIWDEPVAGDARYDAWLNTPELVTQQHGIADEVLPILMGMLHRDPMQRWTLDRVAVAVRRVARWRSD